MSRSDRSQSWRRRGTCSTTRRTRSTRPPPCSPPPPTPTASGLPPRGHTASRSASRSPPRRAQRARSPPRTVAARACAMCSWRHSSCSRPPPANARSPTSTAPSSSSPASNPPAPSRPAPPPSRPPPRRASAGVSPATGAPSACASRWAEPPGSAASACGATWAYATAVSERCVLSCSGPQLTLCAADQTPQSRTPPGRPHLCPRPGGAHRPAGRDAAEKGGRGSRPGRLYDPWRRPSHRQRVVDRCRAGRKRALGYEYSSSCTLIFYFSNSKQLTCLLDRTAVHPPDQTRRRFLHTPRHAQQLHLCRSPSHAHQLFVD